jgi:iron complex transport system substrate-binding protein
LRQNYGGRRDGRPFGIAHGCALLLLLLCHLVFVPGARAVYPVEMKDDRGVAVRLQAEPRRLVALAPSLTEIVFLLGQEKKLVGVTRYCNFPPEAKTLPKIGGIADPDIERIVAAAPDLVLCTTDGNPKEKVLALEEMGIPCFAAAPQDLSGIYAAIERIGALLGVPARARREADNLRARAARAANKEADPVPGVLFVVSTRPIIAAGRATFMDEIIRLAGGRNAAVSFSGRYPRFSVEDLLAVRPDLIFLAAMAGVERFSSEVSRWKEVPAFRDGGIISLDGDLVTRPGPRMVAALEEVSRAVSAWRRRTGESTRGNREKGR